MRDPVLLRKAQPYKRGTMVMLWCVKKKGERIETPIILDSDSSESELIAKAKEVFSPADGDRVGVRA